MSETAQPVFSIQRVYVKDISVETPGLPQGFLSSEQPQLSLNLDIKIQEVESTLFEVALRVTLNSEMNGKSAYLIEVTQGGIFQVEGYGDEQKAAILQIGCPNILYPYIRSQISLLMSQMTVPVFYLPEVNFEEMYKQQQAAA